ncbi:MAG: RidA family protein [Gemmatimonadota bacterium]
MASITPIHAPGTATPVGHYSQAVVHNGLVYVSGQVSADLEAGKPVPGTIDEQTERALRNLERILVAAGSALDRCLQVTVYITKIEDWAAVNAAYKRVMGDARPARAIVPVSRFQPGIDIEIQAIAAL